MWLWGLFVLAFVILVVVHFYLDAVMPKKVTQARIKFHKISESHCVHVTFREEC